MEETQLIEPTVAATVTASDGAKPLVSQEAAANDEHTHKPTTLPLVSHYCLRLLEREKPQLLALAVGTNRLGRSAQSDQCILDKSVSKRHARLHVSLNEDDTLAKCEISDDGAVNHIRIVHGDATVTLDKDESRQIHLGDQIYFGSVKFQLSKMTEAEYSHEQTSRSAVLDPMSPLEETVKNGSGSGAPDTNKKSKLTSLFEIQNTLDDTVVLESKTNGDAKINGSYQNGNGSSDRHADPKICIEDTDAEDEETADSSNAEFHLEMSHSIINQSTFSYTMVPDEDVAQSENKKMTVDEEKIDEKEMEKEHEKKKEMQSEVSVPSSDTVPNTEAVEDTPRSPSIIQNRKVETESKTETETEANQTEKESVNTISAETVFVPDTQPTVTEEVEKKEDKIEEKNDKKMEEEKEKKETETETETIEKKVEEEKKEEKEEMKSVEEEVNKKVDEEVQQEQQQPEEKKETEKKEVTTEPKVSKAAVRSGREDESIIIDDEDEQQMPTPEQEKAEASSKLSVKKSIKGIKKHAEIMIESTLLDTSVEMSQQSNSKGQSEEVEKQTSETDLGRKKGRLSKTAEMKSAPVGKKGRRASKGDTNISEEKPTSEAEQPSQVEEAESVNKPDKQKEEEPLGTTEGDQAKETPATEETAASTRRGRRSKMPEPVKTDEEKVEDENVATKVRGRGRPVKSATEITETPVSEKTEQIVEKTPAVEISVEATESGKTDEEEKHADETVKRGRGRGRQQTSKQAATPEVEKAERTEDLEESKVEDEKKSPDETVSETAKRGRGRGRQPKQAAQEVNEEDGAAVVVEAVDESVNETGKKGRGRSKQTKQTAPEHVGEQVTGEEASKKPDEVGTSVVAEAVDESVNETGKKGRGRGRQAKSTVTTETSGHMTVEEVETTKKPEEDGQHVAVDETANESVNEVSKKGRAVTKSRQVKQTQPEVDEEAAAEEGTEANKPEEESSAVVAEAADESVNETGKKTRGRGRQAKQTAAEKTETGEGQEEAKESKIEEPAKPRRAGKRLSEAALLAPAAPSTEDNQAASKPGASLTRRASLRSRPQVSYVPVRTKKAKAVDESKTEDASLVTEKDEVDEKDKQDTREEKPVKTAGRQRRSLLASAAPPPPPQPTAKQSGKRAYKKATGDEGDAEDDADREDEEEQPKETKARQSRKSIGKVGAAAKASEETEESKTAGGSRRGRKSMSQQTKSTNLLEESNSGGGGGGGSGGAAPTEVASKRGRKSLTAPKVDTYSYEDSDENAADAERKKFVEPTSTIAQEPLKAKRGRKNKNSSVAVGESTEEEEKTTKEGEEATTTSTDTSKKPRKRKSGVADEPTLNTSGKEVSGQKKRRSRASLANVQEAGDQLQSSAPVTPKLFFHTKRPNKTPQSTAESATESESAANTSSRYSNLIQTTPSHVNAKQVAASAAHVNNTSISASPNKKFKLHKAKSSSSENLHDSRRHIDISSSDDDDDGDHDDQVLNNMRKRKQVTINPEPVSTSERQVDKKTVAKSKSPTTKRSPAPRSAGRKSTSDK